MRDSGEQVPEPVVILRYDVLETGLAWYDELCDEWAWTGRGTGGPWLWGKPP